MTTASKLSLQVRVIGVVGAMLIAIHVVNLLTAGALNQFGVIPRALPYITGIFFAPWLHGSVTHLATNLLPLLLFMWLSMQWGWRAFLLTTLTIYIGSGLGVWLFGRSAVHIGASGIVYGYFGFLILAGFLTRRFKQVIISLVVIALYGSMLFGALPGRPMVSFEYHLFGLMFGLLSAWLWVRKQ